MIYKAWEESAGGTDSFTKELRDHIEDGKSHREIGRKYGVSRETAKNWCKRYGVVSIRGVGGNNNPDGYGGRGRKGTNHSMGDIKNG